MKQVHSVTTPRGYAPAGPWWALGSAVPRPMALRRRPARDAGASASMGARPGPSWSWLRALAAVLGGVWFVATLPIRLAFGILALLGRLTGIAIGFLLMVVGMFFLAGPFFLIGIPLFLVGIVLTLRCLD